MKTKAYKLAAELGVPEEAVLDWLRANGFPNIKRGDTLRAELVEAARKALLRQRSAARTASPLKTGAHIEEIRPRKADDPPSMKLSFAELLEAHLPAGPSAGEAAKPEPPRETKPIPPPMASKLPPRREPLPIEAELRARLARADQERERAVRDTEDLRRQLAATQAHLQRVVSVLDEGRAATSRALDLQRELAELGRENERLELERATLRQTLSSLEDERATLEQTCAELQREVATTHEALESLEAEQADQDAVLEDLEAAMQREMAWRARALELERAAHLGGNLPALLTGFGLPELRQQAETLRALLDHRETAMTLFRAIRQVDPITLENLINSRVRRVCAHPVCNQVVRYDEAVPLRVDEGKICEVCRGTEDRRWFARMAQEAARAGVRRLLVIGGTLDNHERLRELSQGQSIDLRLVSLDDELAPNRVLGRVEGCDLVVVFTGASTRPELAATYAECAREQEKPMVAVVGETERVTALSRAVCNRLARNHLLSPG